MLKRMSALFLAALMILSVMLVGCGKQEKPDETTTGESNATTTAVTETTVPEETVDPNNPYDLPTDLNYNGETFHFLVWEQSILEYDVESVTGDMINDAVYNRNRAVEERLGLKLKFTAIPGSSDYVNDFVSRASAGILSGTGEYDSIGCYCRSAGVMAMQGLLFNMLEIDHLDFERPYWPDSLNEMNTIDGQLYYASGDIATSILYRTHIMVENVTMHNKLGIKENPQELALAGKWTVDKLLEMAAGAYQDVNGNGAKDETDIYGLTTISHPWLDSWFVGAGLHYVDVRDEKLVVSDSFSSEKTVKLLEKLNNIFWDTNDGRYADKSSKSYLTEGLSLFFAAQTNTLATDLRDVDYTYAILPMPKYDEKQENYATTIGFTHSLYCVPNDVKDSARVGATLESMAAESYATVSPAIFENAFKSKYSNTELDARCFDLIRSTYVFDVGRIMHDSFPKDRPVNLFRKQIQGNLDTFTSRCAEMVPLYQAVLDDIMQAYKK